MGLIASTSWLACVFSTCHGMFRPSSFAHFSKILLTSSEETEGGCGVDPMADYLSMRSIKHDISRANLPMWTHTCMISWIFCHKAYLVLLLVLSVSVFSSFCLLDASSQSCFVIFTSFLNNWPELSFFWFWTECSPPTINKNDINDFKGIKCRIFCPASIKSRTKVIPFNYLL